MPKPSRPAGWLPAQHGAWAMLFVPFVIGLLLASRVRALTWADATLGLTWLIGYFAFDALRLTLKAAPTRRSRYVPAVATYSLLGAALGLVTLNLGGLRILWWTPIFAVLLGSALVLVVRKKERSIASGVVTILASCGLMPVLRFGSPQAMVTGVNAQILFDATVMLAVTGYFLGTIWHIKALIRERNDPESPKRSAAFHLGLAAVIVGFWVAGWLHFGWAVWGVLLLCRAILLPRHAAGLRPLHFGLIEIGFSLAAAVLAWLA